MNQITNPEDTARLLEQERLQRLEKKRAYNRERSQRIRDANTEASREYIREYMRRTGSARDYYRVNRDTVCAKKREEYKKRVEEEQQMMTAILHM